MEEVWKDVVGFEDYFQISSLGRVFSKRTCKILKLHKNKSGYLLLSTKIGGRSGKSVCFKVHRLVADAFIENPENKPFVNHKNGVKDFNQVQNLEWCTASENSKHAYENGLAKGRKGVNQNSPKLTPEDVIYIRDNYVPRHPIFGARALAKKFSVNHERISSVINNKAWSHIK